MQVRRIFCAGLVSEETIATLKIDLCPLHNEGRYESVVNSKVCFLAIPNYSDFRKSEERRSFGMK